MLQENEKHPVLLKFTDGEFSIAFLLSYWEMEEQPERAKNVQPYTN